MSTMNHLKLNDMGKFPSVTWWGKRNTKRSSSTDTSRLSKEELPKAMATDTPRPPLSVGLSDSVMYNSFSGAQSPNGLSSPLSSSSKPFIQRPGMERISSRGSYRMSSSQRQISSMSQAMRNSRSQYNDSYKITSIQDTAVILKKKSLLELGAGVGHDIGEASFINFIEWIRSERLSSLPHKGSQWDKVLIRAQYFAEQLHNFDVAIQSFALDSTAAAGIGYGHARLLLELGHDNSKALDKVFSFFYKGSLTISTLLTRSELLAVTSETREQLCAMFTDLLTLVTEVAIRLYKTVHGMMYGSTSLNMYEVFGETIETFRLRRLRIIEEIWAYQIEDDGLDLEEVVDVETLSRWLAPQDHVLASLTRDHTTFTDNQAEFTCIWFQKHLSKFFQSTSNFMLVNGAPGSGKTILAASIAERLQRPLGRKSFSTLFCSISGEIPTQATTINVVKSLLYQLLSLRVGNMAVYHSLVAAYKHSRKCSDVEAYESHLWDALIEALKHPNEGSPDLVLIIDGLDELSGDQASPQTFFEQLIRVTEQGKNVKLIGLSRSLKSPPAKGDSVFTIKQDDIRDDIHSVALRVLKACPHFQNRQGPEQESIIGRIIQASNGSFIWTILACELLVLEKSADAFLKLLTTLEKSCLAVQDLTYKVLVTLNLNDDAKTILAWLLEGERPYTFSEIRALFSVDVQSNIISDKQVDIQHAIKLLRPVLSIHENIVRLRHLDIHRSIRTIIGQGKIPTPIKDGEVDLLLRTLGYISLTLKESREPTFDDYDSALLNRLFNHHVLLDYAVRYWAVHLKQSSVFPKKGGEFSIPAELKKVMPDTPVLAILEKLCWETELPTPQALELHVLVGKFRRQGLTENSAIVLQTYITTARYYELFTDLTEASKYYYLASKISRAVLSEFSSLTLECAKALLRVTEKMTFTTRTDLVTFKEEILLLIISAYKRQYGVTSELVIQMETKLAQLYHSIHEEERATEIYVRIHNIMIQIHGKNSDEARDVSEHLHIVVRNSKGKSSIEPLKDQLFLPDEEMEVIEIIQISQVKVIITKAERYISDGQFLKAEQIFIELWQQVSTRCRSTRSIEWHEKNIEIGLTYARFLQARKREIEATAVLTCVWQEYQHHELSFSEGIISQLTEVAKFMKSVGQLTTALTIFKHASYFYKSVRKEETKSSTEIETEISVTSLEVVKRSLSSTTVTETSSTVSESTFKSVFHSIITNTSKTIDTTTMTLAKKLTVEYAEKQQWSEAISIVQATLQRTWSSFFSESVQSVTLTSTFLEESLYLVEQLASCYLQLRQLEKVEDVYVRLFRAVLVSKKTEHPLFDKAKWLLVNFYDKYGFPDKAIGVFQEVLVVYKKTLGESHRITIQTLYTLGSRCRNHARNHSYWIEYYQQILAILNKSSDICHLDAVDAILIVATYYWEDRRFAEAITVYSVLWNTFVVKKTEYKQFSDAQFVKTTYERYFQCLEETRTELDILHKITTEYRETCVKSFGISAAISVEATLSLARVSQRSEKFSSQAISLYEEVTKSTTTSTTQKSEIKETLLKLYMRQITSKSTSTVKTETVERAISIHVEQYSSAKSTYGYLSMTTLSHMRELLVLYSRQSKTELIVKELTASAVQIITQEKSAQKLLQYATYIAETFQICHQESSCYELIEELHCQIIAKRIRNTSKFAFDLTKCGRASLSFLAGLQYHLRTEMQLTFSEIMVDLIAEVFQYDNFRQLMEANEALDTIMIAAAPLRSFLVRKNYSTMVKFLDDEIISVFIKRDSAKVKMRSQNSPRIFLLAILEYLSRKSSSNNFVKAVIQSSNENIIALLKGKLYAEAYDVAGCAFLFAKNRNGYKEANAISQGFKLALLLAGKNAPKCPDQGLRDDMLQLSNRIIKEILEICKSKNINFAQVQLVELNQLTSLLGEQKDYQTLEWLLSTLWNTREAQRSWPSKVLLNLGRRLICARYLAGHYVQALRLCEDIAYNMRRVHGIRHPATLETYQLLAQLYTSVGENYQKAAGSDKATAVPLAQQNYKKALLVHEDLLKMLVYDGATDGDDDDDELESTAAILSQHGHSINGGGSVQSLDTTEHHSHLSDSGIDFSHNIDFIRQEFRLLKYAYQRLGGWPKPAAEYEKLNADLYLKYGEVLKGVEGVEKWAIKGFGSGKAESPEGAFSGCSSWEFADIHHHDDGVSVEEEEL